MYVGFGLSKLRPKAEHHVMYLRERTTDSLQEQSVKPETYGLPSLWNPKEKGLVLVCLLKSVNRPSARVHRRLE